MARFTVLAFFVLASFIPLLAHADMPTVAVLSAMAEGEEEVYPLVSWREGAWTAEDFMAVAPSEDGERGELSAEQQAYLDALMKAKFVVPQRNGVTLELTVASPDRYGYYVALKGKVRGVPQPFGPRREFLVVNDAKSALPMQPSYGFIGYDLRESLPDKAAAAVKAFEESLAKEPDSRRPSMLDQFDASLFAAPQTVESWVIDIPGGDAIIWSVTRLGYPASKGPEHEDGDSEWTTVYETIETVSEGKLLWSDLQLLGDWMAQKRLLGATDLNGDNQPELVFVELGYEYHAYTVYTLKDGELQQLALRDYGI